MINGGGGGGGGEDDDDDDDDDDDYDDYDDGGSVGRGCDGECVIVLLMLLGTHPLRVRRQQLSILIWKLPAVAGSLLLLHHTLTHKRTRAAMAWGAAHVEVCGHARAHAHTVFAEQICTT